MRLWASESLVADGNDLSVRELVALLERGGVGGGGGEGVASLGEDLHEVVSEISAGQVESEDGVGKGITFVDWDSVGDTISGIENDTGGSARGVEREDGLDGDVHGGGVEGLEHDLGHLLTVGLGVEGSLSEEDGVLLWGDSELVVESLE